MAAAVEDAVAETAVLSQPIARSRYSGDVARLKSLADGGLMTDGPRSLRAQHHQSHVRGRLLADGVRADASLLPGVAAAVERLTQRAGIAEPVEAYVVDEGSVNAFVTRGRTRILVGLSSGCVNSLTPRELEFVIGHELGHLAFGHVDVETPHLHQGEGGGGRAGMALRAWQRAAEISADRAGLICCGSLEIAASALFKTACGVRVPEGSIDPRAFAAQWHELEREIAEAGGQDDWQASHPFPPLRMRALLLYWDALAARGAGPEDTTAPPELEADLERLLAMTDPLAREGARAADPVLTDFLLWGGLAVIAASPAPAPDETALLRSLLPPGRLDPSLPEARTWDACKARFREALSQRHGKLRAMEIHRIMEGLLAIAHARGAATEAQLAALRNVGEMLGVGSRACELLLERHGKGAENARR